MLTTESENSSMKLETAAYVHALLLATSRTLNEALRALQEEVGEEDSKEYRLATGHILDALMEDFLKPIYREHKQLIPRELENLQL
jgi:hypothetical protein